MPGWGARELLALWEQTAGRSPAEQALALLADAFEPPELTLGSANFHLLLRHAESFGPGLELFASCPVCGDELEAHLPILDLLQNASEATSAASEGGPVEVAREGLTATFRLPTFGDLAALAAEPVDGAAPEDAEGALLARCLVSAERRGEALGAEGLSAEERAEAAARLAAADPLAEILLDLACPRCGHGWQALVEPAACLARAVETTARRVLAEVHALGRAYGWREEDVLALSPWRRRAYLDLVAA